MAFRLFPLLIWWLLSLPGHAQALAPTVPVPKIELNTLDLNTGIPLNTTWHFVGPDHKMYATTVPARWEKVYHSLWPVFGQGIYTLDIHIPEAFVGRNLKFYSEFIAGSDVKVFVNNKQVGRNGLSEGSRSRISDFSAFTADTDVLRIRVEVSNDVLQWSGIVQPLWIGNNEAILKMAYRRSIDFNSMIAIFSFLAFFHLILFVLFRQDTTVFWFSALCFCIVVYMEFFRVHNLEYLLGDIPLEWNIRVIRITLYAIIPLAFWYAHSLSPRYVSRNVVNIITAISVGFALTLVLPSRTHSPLIYLWFLFVCLCMIYNIYLLIRLCFRHQLNTSIYASLAINGLIFSVSSLNDILNALHIWNNGFYGRYGFLVFCLVQTCFLAARLQKNIRDASQLQHALKHINENLEGLVEQRTDEVQRQNIQLQELMHFKEEMVEMLVHDLKTPLNVLMSLPAKPQTGELPLVMEASERVNTLISQMVNINQKDAAQIPLYIQTHSLHQLCQKLIRVMQPWALSKDILLANLLTSQSLVLVDAPLFERVIQNLLENAIKHAPEHSEIKITGHLQNNVFQCSIFNQAKPLPEQFLTSIFKKGVSMDSAEAAHSTGLGLYFCHQVLKAHGGSIRVENVYSPPAAMQGVQFVLQIPSPQTEVDTVPSWNPQQLRQLLPAAQTLLKLEVFQISELRPILERLQGFEDPDMKTWVEHLHTSIKEVNETKYRQLLEQICTYSDR